MQAKISEEKASPGLEKFAKEFFQDRCSELSLMQESLKRKDFEGIRKVAHKWKGFCTPYGFHYLENLSQEVEKVASEKDFVKISSLLEEISSYLEEKGKFLGVIV